jgi:hypothetical protein
MSPNSDLASWLEAIGLSKHLELFREHSLDLDIVLDLTEEDLLTLGLPLGDRKRFLRESAALHTRRPIQSSRGSATKAKTTLPNEDGFAAFTNSPLWAPLFEIKEAEFGIKSHR